MCLLAPTLNVKLSCNLEIEMRDHLDPPYYFEALYQIISINKGQFGCRIFLQSHFNSLIYVYSHYHFFPISLVMLGEVELGGLN